MNTDAKLAGAKAKLVLRHPFFGAVLLRKQIVTDTAVKTACVNSAGSIKVNPEFVGTLSTNQVAFLLAHEALHYMLGHSSRRGWRDAKRWNTACDKVVNETLINEGVGVFIEGGARHPGAAAMSAEQVYDMLVASSEDPDDGNGEGNGEGNSPGGIGEDLDESPPQDEEGKALSEGAVAAQLKRDLVESRNAAKMAGNLPGGLARIVDDVVHVPVPWYQVLEHVMTAVVPTDYSWTRPARRYIWQDMYLPGVDREPRLGHVVIAVDTSGSVSRRELAEFEKHINDVLVTCNPERTSVLYVDTEVAGVDEYTNEELPLRFRNPKGGGGTRFTPAFDWADKSDIDVLVYFTDMHGEFPCSPPRYPTVWVSTSGRSAPFGVTVQIHRANRR